MVIRDRLLRPCLGILPNCVISIKMDPASVFNQIREILCFRVHLEGILSRQHGSSAFGGILSSPAWI